MEAPVPVWGLVDDRTGHTGQVLGVIGKLGLPFVLKRLEYNWKTYLPAALTGATLSTLDQSHSAPIAPPWPALVIAAGRRTIPIAQYIKKKSPKTVIAYLMWPGTDKGFDLIAVPLHDEVKHSSNVITTTAPLHAVTPETLNAAREAWLPRFKDLPRPWVAITIGGNTKNGKYSAADWRELVTRARHMIPTGTLMITTSRRTPPEALDVIVPLLAGGAHLLHRWDVDKDNPYLGLLGCADIIIPTGDSLSMCTEACVSGKPVYIFAPDKAVPKKHKRLHQSLYDKSLARPLDSDSTIDWKPASGLDDAGLVAETLKTRFPNIRRGFSLVELSIVLVILGLLTGGILAGQSLIRASELRAVATEFQRYQAAGNTFRDKYFALPGDFRDATKFWNLSGGVTGCVSNSGVAAGSPGACDGNGDGAAANAAAGAQWGERHQFWRQLALAGLIEGSYTGISGPNAFNHHIIGTNTPGSKLSGGGWTMASWDNTAGGSASVYAMNFGNLLWIGAQVTNAITNGPVMRPEEAWNIDTKLDDGKPAQGKVIAVWWSNACAAADDGTTAENDFVASYRLSDATNQCALTFRQVW